MTIGAEYGSFLCRSVTVVAGSAPAVYSTIGCQLAENTTFPTPRDIHGQKFERRQGESHTKSATFRREEDGDIAEQ